jgi:hypothetical protein
MNKIVKVFFILFSCDWVDDCAYKDTENQGIYKVKALFFFFDECYPHERGSMSRCVKAYASLIEVLCLASGDLMPFKKRHDRSFSKRSSPVLQKVIFYKPKGYLTRRKSLSPIKGEVRESFRVAFDLPH